MKTPRTTNVTDSPRRAIVLTLAGIITAILCVLALLNDTYTKGSEGLGSTRFIETSSVPNISVFVAPVSTIVLNMQNLMLIGTNVNN